MSVCTLPAGREAAGRPAKPGNLVGILSSVDRRVKIAPSRCGSLWCSSCRAVTSGTKRSYLKHILSLFAEPVFLTLTVDPRRFDGPGEAWRFVRTHRLLSELMRFLDVERWVWVLEDHKSGWPHWHFVVDGRVDIDRCREWWTRRCGVGPADRLTRVHVKPFSAERAANYLGGYLSKGGSPPEWVLRERNVRCISVARCLPSLSGFQGKAEPDSDVHIKRRRRGRHTIGERLADCSTDSVVLEEEREVCDDGSRRVVRRKYVGRLSLRTRDVVEVANRLGVRVESQYVKRVGHWTRDANGKWIPHATVPIGLRSVTMSPSAAKYLRQCVNGNGGAAWE